MARNVLIGIVGVIVVVLIALFFIRRGQGATEIVFTPIPTINSFQQSLETNFGITVPTTAVKADLKDVTGGNQMGIATLDKSSGQNVYSVIANLDEPPAGYFYQAWLVRPSDNDTISLGQLNIGKGGWIANYTSTSDVSDHKNVIVTEEKNNDTTPEKHILEGNF